MCASFAACRDTCSLLWPAVDSFDLDEGCRLSAAETSPQASLHPRRWYQCGVRDPVSEFPVEAFQFHSQLGCPSVQAALFEACPAPGAGAWLTATPASLDNLQSSFAPASPHAGLGQRLGLRHVRGSDGQWGDHAL